MSAPALDGSSATQVGSNAGTLTAVLTTSLADDIIIAIADVHSSSGTIGVSGVTCDGHAMTLRSSKQVSSSYSMPLLHTVWWYHSAGALAARNIIATFANDTGTSIEQLIAFGVHGCDLVNPFDPDVSLPATSNSTAGFGRNAPRNVVFSTSNLNTFVFESDTLDHTETGATDASWTLLGNITGGTYGSSYAAYQQFTSAQTTVTQSVYANNAAGNGDVASIDALQAPAPVTRSVAALIG